MKRLRAAAVLTLLIGYLAAFYFVGLRNDFGRPICDEAGHPARHLDQLWPLVLPEGLLPIWFGKPLQFSLADRLPVLLIAAAILVWAWAVGWLVLRALMPKTDKGFTRLEIFLFSGGVGLNLLSTWVLLLGLVGLLGRFWLFTLPATLTLLAAAGIACRGKVGQIANLPRLWQAGRKVGQIANLPRLWQAGRKRKPGRENRGEASGDDQAVLGTRWLWAALPFLLLLVLAGMLPPTDFDVCEYHLQAPKEFFEQGKIGFLPHNVYANMPLGTEMLSLLAMSVAGNWWWGALAGKLVTAMFAPLCALGLLAAGRRFYSTAAGVVAALLYLSIPWILSVSSQGLIDGALACYLLLALYAVLLWIGGAGSRCLALAGYLAGAAAATKYTGILFVLVPLAGWVVVGRGMPGGGRKIGSWQIAVRRRLFALAVFLLAAALGCGLWFAKNWALTGNPTYPLFSRVFDGKTWNAEKEARWNRVHRPHDFSLPTLAADAGRVVLTSPGLSPLLMPLAALAFLCRSKTPAPGRWSPSRGLLAYALIVLAAWWLLTLRIDRFFIPVLPVLALLGGAGATCFRARWWRPLLAGTLGAGLAANFAVASSQWNNAWFVPLAALRHDPQRIKPWHEFFNAHAADGGVLAVGDAACFDIEAPVLYNICFDDCIFQRLVEGRTADEVHRELLARHIAYVYVDWGEIARYRRPENYGFTDFVQPAVFDRLVDQGVLLPLEPIDGSATRTYRVR